MTIIMVCNIKFTMKAGHIPAVPAGGAVMNGTRRSISLAVPITVKPTETEPALSSTLSDAMSN